VNWKDASTKMSCLPYCLLMLEKEIIRKYQANRMWGGRSCRLPAGCSCNPHTGNMFRPLPVTVADPVRPHQYIRLKTFGLAFGPGGALQDAGGST
jgi:hypothetical protein